MNACSLFRHIVRLAMISSLAAILSPLSFAGGDGRIHWKKLGDAQLRLDGRPPLTWNVYQPEKSEKKNHLVLVLIGRRYLALDYKSKQVFQVLPADLQAEGNGFSSGDLFVSDRLVPSDEWTVRDVGPAEQIKLTLKDYGRQMEIQLRHPPDNRAFY
jgi:hypothetical protein